jgi:hypothetical protein
MERGIKVLQGIIEERKLVMLRSQYIRRTLCILNQESLSLGCSQIVMVEIKIKLASANKKSHLYKRDCFYTIGHFK